ncbi:M23 family metallopeptidase [Kordia jejudonensis]|uniref:M23 family metallopeptidase n=1 Tax=Kordia jejudonensis TaxID=1348245 RepID=UPI000699461E|nr:M23 family metallopeptidase [Kordia jejudonensis]
MKKYILLLVCIFIFGNLFAQNKDVEIIKKQNKNVIVFYVKNNTHATQSLQLTFDGYGYTLDKESPLLLIIPPKKQIEGVTLTFSKTEKSKYSYKSTYTLGNINAVHDTEYAYTLPYKKGTSHQIMQGYDGSFSHKGKKAIDFNMPVNTPIYATRDGVVIKIKKNSKKGCPTVDCIDDGNLIMIEHVDGSIGEYVHLRYRGVTVKLGDKIKRGQKIGYSGNTGFSSAPHLHFQVFIYALNGDKKTITTMFEIEKDKSIILKKGDNYKRIL